MTSRSKTTQPTLQLWRTHLDEAGLRQNDKLGRRLIARHAQGWRRYHGLSHLNFLFSEIATLGAQISHRPRLLMTTWFHDAIYLTWRKDNEARSADWAERALAELGGSATLIENVSQLIRRTANHAEGGRDHDDNLFLDMDCAILGAPAKVYLKYAKGVQAEYWWVPAKRYRDGRMAFLESQMKREPLFLTEAFEVRFGAQARENMRDEIEGL